MKTFIYRNSTVENLFLELDADYSGYGDIVSPKLEYERLMWFYTLPFKSDPEKLVDEIIDYQNKLAIILSAKPPVVPIYCFTLLNTLNNVNWVNGDGSVQKAVCEFNVNLYELSSKDSSIKVIDIHDFFKSYSLSSIFDWRFFYTSEVVFTPKVSADFYGWFLKKDKAILQQRKKCLVLDLDNTMWGGVLGEDGIDGIELGDTYPGNVFLDFQRCVVEASKNGVILAVCSKNNESDVLRAWGSHPFMQINKNNISAYRINWIDKATNISEIAEELNIGLDSMVFVDDSPIERERIKKFLPEVTVPDFPKNTFELISFFNRIYEDNFQVYSISDEDKQKASQYSGNRERKQYKKNFDDIDAYYKSLEMELIVHVNDNHFIPRLAQMTQKTNQFNLTTKRYSQEDIKNFMVDEYVLSLEVNDKFGNNGVTVLAVIKKESEDVVVLDSFLLSCRILGRGIEKAFISYLHNFLFERGFKYIKAMYIPTKKNENLTSCFLDECGYKTVSENNGIKEYCMEVNEKININNCYRFTESNER